MDTETTNVQPVSTGSQVDNDKILAVLASCPLIGLVIYFAMNDASAFVKNYAKQGSVLTIFSFVLSIVQFIPVVNLVLCIAWPVLLVLILILCIKALQEEKTYQLPIVGDLAKSIFK